MLPLLLNFGQYARLVEKLFLGTTLRRPRRPFAQGSENRCRYRQVVPVLPRNDPCGIAHLHHTGGHGSPAHFVDIHHTRRRIRQLHERLPAHHPRHARPRLAHRPGTGHRPERGTHPHRQARVHRRARPFRDLHPRLRPRAPSSGKFRSTPPSCSFSQASSGCSPGS